LFLKRNVVYNKSGMFLTEEDRLRHKETMKKYLSSEKGKAKLKELNALALLPSPVVAPTITKSNGSNPGLILTQPPTFLPGV